MHLYQGTSAQFIADATQARLANQLSDRFFEEFRCRPAPSEVTSWRNSLGAMASVLQLPLGPVALEEFDHDPERWQTRLGEMVMENTISDLTAPVNRAGEAR
jgi:hypothetical protein